MKILYQCLVCGKTHSSQDSAEKCHEGPIQGFETGITKFSKRKGMMGN